MAKLRIAFSGIGAVVVITEVWSPPAIKEQ